MLLQQNMELMAQYIKKIIVKEKRVMKIMTKIYMKNKKLIKIIKELDKFLNKEWLTIKEEKWHWKKLVGKFNRIRNILIHKKIININLIKNGSNK